MDNIDYKKTKKLLGRRTEFEIQVEWKKEGEEDVAKIVLKWLEDPPAMEMYKSKVYLKCKKQNVDVHKKWDIYHVIQKEITEDFLRIEKIDVGSGKLNIYFINYV
jgi:hypothetical protein